MSSETYTNKILLGDCLDLLPGIPDRSVDMILCDLPYGVTACAWDKRIPMERLFHEYRRVIKKGGVIALTATQPFATDLINAARDWFRYDLVWDKWAPVGFLNARRMPLRRHELVLIFYESLPTYRPQFSEGKPYKRQVSKSSKAGVYRETNRTCSSENPGIRYPTSMLLFPRETRGLVHPTQKPIALFEYLIRTYTDEGEIVLDTCMGSGTTAVACLRSGRRFVGMEQDPIYFKRIIERVEEMRRQLTRLAA